MWGGGVARCAHHTPTLRPLRCQRQAGGTPLGSAVWRGHLACVTVLLAAGANVNSRDNVRGCIAACATARAVARSVVQCSGVVWCGVCGGAADVREARVVSVCGRASARVSVLGCVCVWTGGGGHLTRVRRPTMLWHHHHQRRRTPLMFAAAKGHVDCIVPLLAAGASLEARDKFVRTNGCAAVDWRDRVWPCVCVCVSCVGGGGGAIEHRRGSLTRPHMRDTATPSPRQHWWTALMQAANKACVVLLAAAGADLNATGSVRGARCAR